MKIKTLIMLSAAALSLVMLVPEPAEAHRTGYRHQHRRSNIGPLRTEQHGNRVVRERRYGDCYVRNVTRYNRYGQKVVRRTKTC